MKARLEELDIKENEEEIKNDARVLNCITRFLKQFEARTLEAMAIGNFLTKIKEGSSSVLAMLATI